MYKLYEHDCCDKKNVCVCLSLSPPTGWSTAALQEWGSYMKLAIPSTLMLCFEWWVYEIGGFLAGL